MPSLMGGVQFKYVLIASRLSPKTVAQMLYEVTEGKKDGKHLLQNSPVGEKPRNGREKKKVPDGKKSGEAHNYRAGAGWRGVKVQRVKRECNTIKSIKSNRLSW